MEINIIAAVAKNRAIGLNNKLLYWLPNDLKRFKQLTSGHTILMGRKTYESLPKGALPNRRNVVVSRSVEKIEGCDCYSSINEAIDSCDSSEQIFVIGGGSIYEQTLPLADNLYLTEVDDTPKDADTFFPDYSEWKEVKRECHEKDERHAFNYAFVDYSK